MDIVNTSVRNEPHQTASIGPSRRRRSLVGLGALALAASCAAPADFGGVALPTDGGVGDETSEVGDDVDEAVYALSATSGPVIAIRARQDTFFKATTAQSSTLPADRRCAVASGTRLVLTSAAIPAEAGHYRIRPATPLAGCALSDGFVFGEHFDSLDAITATHDTWLKVSTADSSTLAASARCWLPRGTVLTLAAAPRTAAAGHFSVTVDPIPGCALRTAFVFGAHFGLASAPPSAPSTTPSGGRIDSVPYRYQYHNRYEPSATCGLTSASMLLGYYGTHVTPDALYLRFGKPQGQSPGNLASLYRTYGLYATSTYSGTFAQVRRHLDAGRPVVVHGDFTRSGHVVLIVGYDDRGFIFHDPSGLWSGTLRGGYPARTSTNGRFVHYSLASLERVIGPSGNVWMSVASRTPL